MGKDSNAALKKGGKRSLFGNGLPVDTGKFDWSSIPAEDLAELIQAVTSRGGAVRFGYSRDGNAGNLAVYMGEAYDSLWIRPTDEWSYFWQKLDGVLQKLPVTNGAEPRS